MSINAEKIHVDAIRSRVRVQSQKVPIYSEAQWRRKIRDNRKLVGEFLDHVLDESVTDPPLTSRDAVAYLIRQEIAELIRRAHLTRSDVRLFLAVAMGERYDALARERGVLHYDIKTRVQDIRRRLRKAAANYPFTGLWHIYQAQISHR